MMNLDRWIAIVGLVAALIFGVVSIIQAKRANRKKEPIYSITTEKLIKSSVSKYSGLEIRYNGQKVENFFVSKIAFWNNGKTAIRKNDIPDSTKIELKNRGDGIFYNVSIIYNSNPSNEFGILFNPIEKTAQLIFNYLDTNQGVIIQLLHNEEDTRNILILGDIIESEIIKRLQPPVNVPLWIRIYFLFTIIILFLDVIYLTLKHFFIDAIPGFESLVELMTKKPDNLTTTAIVVGLMWLMTITFTLFFGNRYLTGNKLPKHIRKALNSDDEIIESIIKKTIKRILKR